MFVVLNQGLQGNPTVGEHEAAETRWRASGGADAGCLEIGLVNNMPDLALRATERQFSKLLAAAAGEWTVRLHFFGLDAIPRGEEARSYMRATYGGLAELESADLDALIVTGCEPQAERLSDEQLIDLLFTVGQYALVSMALNSLGVEREAEVPGWPS